MTRGLAWLLCLGLLGAAPPSSRSEPAHGSVWAKLDYLADEMPEPLSRRRLWESRDVYYFRSVLSPGLLIRMKSSTVTFFSDLSRYGAQPPSFFLVKSANGTRSFERGESAAGDELQASWIVASFQGARGWEQFDAPWFISLEKRPSRVALTDDGLVLEFAEPDSGYLFSMPLYGYYKPPQEKNDFARKHGLPSSGVRPWTWKVRAPESLVRRCDWWARVAKAYPIGFQESFSVNPATDAITFRQEHKWLEIRDDWGTEPLRFAPLSPSLGLAWLLGGFPMQVSAPVHDPDYFTAFGPYVGVIEEDRVEASLQVLQYLNELEQLRTPESFEARHREALGLIVGGMENKFRSDWRYSYDHGSRENFCWNLVGDVWYPRGLPFVDEDLRERAKSSLRLYMDYDVLQSHSPYHGKYLLHGPGIGSWGEWGDAGKFMSNSLQAIWAYAQYSGDWDLIRRRWSLIQRFFVTPEEADWVSFGRRAIAEIGDEAAPCSAYARMAWALGDPDEYLFGAYMFARELVHLYVKQKGGSYFYGRQPYNQYQPMPPRIYPTDLWGSTRGWQVDGPAWGHLESGEHQSANRWMRFHDPDVGRFYRDHLRKEAQEELDWYQRAAADNPEELHRAEAYRDWLVRDNPHAMTSLARLQSFLLGLPGVRLQGALNLAGYRTGWGAADIAVGYSFLRAMTPIQHVRLVPADIPASPFVLGLQRKGLMDHVTTVQEIWDTGIRIEPRWHGWDMPRSPDGTREGRYRSFGAIRGDFGRRVSGPEGSQWISYGCQVSWADAVAPRKLTDPGGILAAQDRTPVAVAGPFSNSNDVELTAVAYPPESGDSNPTAWRFTRLEAGRRVDLSPELSDGNGQPAATLAYVQQYVWSPREISVYLLAGHQGGLQAWINEERVVTAHGAHLPTHADASRGLGRLKKGWNRILLKTESFTDRFTVQFRLVGTDRQPIPGLKFEARPPRAELANHQ